MLPRTPKSPQKARLVPFDADWYSLEHQQPLRQQTALLPPVLCCPFLAPVPAGEVSHLLPYTALLASQGLHRSTISSLLAAIRHYSIINGHGDPTKDALMLGYARKGAASSSLPSPLREAVTLPTLLDFLSRLDLHSYDDSLFFAMASLAFFAFLRISEYTLANRFDPD